MSKHEVTHDEAFAALDAVALDALEANERDAILAHVAWCTECRAELKKLRATASQLAFAPQIAVGESSASRDRVRARLMARATTDAANREIIRRTPPTGLRNELDTPAPPAASITDIRTWRRTEWIAAAASVLFALTLGGLAWSLNNANSLRQQLKQEIAFNQQTVAKTDSVRAVRDSMISSLLGRDVSVMRLTSAGAKSPFALMFWDKARNVWTFSAHNMPELRAGRTYQLWLVTATAKISAGTFSTVNGDAVVRATYRLAPDALRALAVTEEIAGGAPQPTSAPIIAVSATQ